MENQSHPIRGGWIEIPDMERMAFSFIRSHPIRGGWIEIRRCQNGGKAEKRPTPYGVGGLKSTRILAV